MNEPASRADRFGLPLSLLAAAAAFTMLFTGVVFHFWAQMTLSVSGLCLLAWAFDRAGFAELLRISRKDWPKAVVLGVLSAALLYCVFLLGNLAARAMFEFSQVEIAGVYELKRGTPLWLVGLLLGVVIGPGEELFWRGYVQRKLVGRYRLAGLAASVAAYTLVHLGSWNLMLILAALICGLFWALLYYWQKSIWLNVISHTLWDLAIFVFWPVAGS